MLVVLRCFSDAPIAWRGDGNREERQGTSLMLVVAAVTLRTLSQLRGGVREIGRKCNGLF